MQTVGVNRDFWKGRRVFVTGHTGFIGGWLSAWLGALGARTAGYALAPSTRPSFFECFDLGEQMISVIGDIGDQETLGAAVAEFAPQVIIHLAAQALVREAHASPVETFATNVMGTAHLMEAIRHAPSVTSAVIMTTDKVYQNQEWEWGYREDDRIGGREPYGCSKACAEHVVDAFRESYFKDGDRSVGIATVRAGNVIGGGDWAADRLVPDAIRAFAAGRPLHIRNPGAVRPWQHALDPIAGILQLAERLADEPDRWAGPWNFGPPETEMRSVSDVADQIVRLWGDGARWTDPQAGGTENHAKDPYEARLLAINPIRAMTRLGWGQRWSLDRALAATVDWYKAQIAGADMRALSNQQIAAFEGTN